MPIYSLARAGLDIRHGAFGVDLPVEELGVEVLRLWCVPTSYLKVNNRPATLLFFVGLCGRVISLSDRSWWGGFGTRQTGTANHEGYARSNECRCEQKGKKLYGGDSMCLAHVVILYGFAISRGL